MITVKNLTKRYGDFTAVNDLSFEIEDGHIYGFLGPNGAGKSTTLNIITGCLAATAGEVKINDFDIFENAKEAKKLIGYLPEIPPLYTDQTPREYLQFVAMAKGIKKAQLKDEIQKVIEETHIEDVSDKLIKHLSKGYRQRVGIAQALLGNPSVIILDEPTVGLDPAQIIEIRTLIQELGKKHTVILSSHILPEVQAICEKILIIYKGQLVAFDTPENLSESMSSGLRVNMTVVAKEAKVNEVLGGMTDEMKYEVSEEDGLCKVTIEAQGEDSIVLCKDLFFAFADAKAPIIQMNTVKATLEDIFIELTHGEEEPADGSAEDSDEASEEEFDADEFYEEIEDNTENAEKEAETK